MHKTIKLRPLIALIAVLFVLSAEMNGQGSSVRIIKSDKSWQLEINRVPFYVKGVVGDEYLSKVKEYGGNSIRTGWRKKELNEAYGLGLNALVNLPANAERYGMDYNDSASVRKQTAEIVSIVRQTKDHPAVLMWA